MLYDLAVYHLIDVDARQSDPSAAGPQSEPFVLMDAGSAHTRDDGVALGDLVLDGYVEIAVSVCARPLDAAWLARSFATIPTEHCGRYSLAQRIRAWRLDCPY